MLPLKKLLLVLFFLFFVPSAVSFFRLFKITINSSSSTSSSLPAATLTSDACSHAHLTTTPHSSQKLTRRAASSEEMDLSAKEYQLLSKLISQRAPCDLLFFGFRPQFLVLAALNAAGSTVFLEDDEEKLTRAANAHARASIYRVKYSEKASKAYELLKHARKHSGCRLESALLQNQTGCRLWLNRLPREVQEREWDVVVVDGPRGDGPEAPGRMAAIYTARVMARSGNSTDVLVHDVDRVIEKWYAWEFLCHENLISSKGKLWHFRVEGGKGSVSFCPESRRAEVV